MHTTTRTNPHLSEVAGKSIRVLQTMNALVLVQIGNARSIIQFHLPRILVQYGIDYSFPAETMISQFVKGMPCICIQELVVVYTLLYLL